MEDITTQLQNATSEPAEAAKVIGDASKFNMDADSYKEHQPYMQTEADLMKLYKDVTPGVSQYSKLSSQHASLIKNDTFKLSQVESTFSSAMDKITGKDILSKITDLNRKKETDPANFTSEQRTELFLAKEEFENKRKFQIPKEGKNAKLVNEYFEKKKDFNILNSAFARYGSALFNQAANTTQIPTLAYDLYYYPANLIRAFKGEPEIKAPKTLTENKAYTTFKKIANDINALAPEVNRDITDAIGSGDFGEAGQIAAIKLAGQIPNLTTMLVSSLALGPNASLGITAATSAAQSNTENAEKGLSPTQSLPNALTKGFLEGVTEKLGTLSAFKRLESSLTFSFGKDSAGKVMFNMAKSMLGASGQEFTEEALNSVAQDFTDIISGVAPEKLNGIAGRALEAGVVGGLTGGLLTAPAAAVKARSNILMDNQIRDAQAKAVSLLDFDSDVQNALDVLKETEMSKHSKEEQANFLKGIFKGVGLQDVYVNIEALREKATSPEKAEAVRKIIDPTGETNAKLNAPIKVPAHQFFPLTFEFPELAEEYSLSPEEASVRQAKEYLMSVQEAQQSRQDVLSKLEIENPTPEDISMIQQALNPEQPSAVYPSNDVYGEAEYLDTTNMEKAMKGIVSDTDIESIVRDQTKAKQEIVDNINETAELEMNQVLDVQMLNVMEAEKEAQFQRLENNPNVLVVDRFANPTALPTDTVLQSVKGFEELHSKPGYSPLAIDPETLPPELKALKKNERLKKSKVFVKGGLNVYDSAALLGFESPEAMFDVLTQTPSREEIAEQRAEARRSDLELEAKEQIGLNEAGITKAYEARLTNALATMKIMKDKFWSSTIKGFKGIALTPSPRALIYEAKQAIAKSKIKDLNVNQFKVGERKSERVAWDAITKNQVEKAFVNQKAVAQNIALTMQTQIAIGKVNREIRFARKFTKPSIIQELKDAGPLYYEAAQEMLNAFNFGTKNDTAEKASFTKWAEKVALEGNGDFKIPDRLLDQRESFKEMTVEQVMAVGQALRGILHTARYKNKLFKKFENIKTLQTLENFGNMVEENASKVFDYDPEKSKTYQNSAIGKLDRASEFLLGMKGYLERTQHVLVKLDDGNVNGFFNTLFWRPLVDASNNKKLLIKETQAHLESIINEFGKDQWDNLASEFVEIPEFENVPGFKKGKMSKADLLAMELNFGNEGNIAELEKFGVDRTTIRKVLDRELTDRHTALVQNIWNMYESFKPKMDELQRRTKGEATVWVEAKPFVARGKEYPGGYYPIFRLSDKLKVQARKAQGLGVMNNLERFKLNYYGDAMTEQGHLKARTGNDDFIDLKLNAIGYSMNQIVHDLTHREVVADGVKLLADKKIRESMANVIGKEGYENVVGTYISTAQEVENDSYGENGFLTVMNELGAGLQVAALAGNVTSVAIQPASIFLALEKMGKTESAPVFARVVKQMLSNPSLILAFVEVAEQINPAIAKFTEDVQKNASSTLNETIPTKKNKIVDPLVTGRDHLLTGAFKGLSGVDKINKVLVTLTAYQMALEGKVKGLEHLKGNVEESMVYASNISELTQTHNDVRNLSPIQKNAYMKQYVYFFNDLNNLYNNTIANNREVRSQFSKGNYWQSGVAFAGFVMTLTALKTYEQFVRGNPLPGDDKEKSLLSQWFNFLTTDVPDMLIDTIPYARDISFAVENYARNRKIIIEPPIIRAMSTYTTGIIGLTHYIDFLGENQSLPERERRAIWESAGMALKIPAPQFYKHFVREKPDKEYLKKGPIDRLSEGAQKIYNSVSIPKEFKEKLYGIESRVNPKNVVVEKNDYNILKEMISNSNPTAYNENTGAAGIYQFTEEQWNKIMQEAPELGLTENGRVMQKTEQQQKAFEYTSKKSGEVLRSAGYEVNTETLYASHIMGAYKAIQVFSADDSTKVEKLLNSKILEQYKIPKDYSVGDLKNWLSVQVVKANRRLTKE